MFSSTPLFNYADVGGHAKRTETGYPLHLFGTKFEPIDLSEEFCNELCSDAPLDSTGRFHDRDAVIEKLKRMIPEFSSPTAIAAVLKIEALNVEKRSKLAAQNNVQTSGSGTPPAGGSSTILTSSLSSNDSQYTESGFVSAQEDDEATAVQSLPTQPNHGSNVRAATSSIISTSGDEETQNIFSSKKASKAPLSQIFTSTLPSGGASNISQAWEDFKASSAAKQPIKFYDFGSSTAKPLMSSTEDPKPEASISQTLMQNAAPKPSLPDRLPESSPQSRSADTSATLNPSILSEAAQDQLPVQKPLVSETDSATDRNVAQATIARKRILDDEDYASSSSGSSSLTSTSTSGPAEVNSQPPVTPDPDEELHKWIKDKYIEIGFDGNTSNFIGWSKFSGKLLAHEPDEAKHAQIDRAVSRLRRLKRFPDPTVVQQDKSKARRERLRGAQGPSLQHTASSRAETTVATTTASQNTAPQAMTQSAAPSTFISRTSTESQTIQAPASHLLAMVSESSEPPSSSPPQALHKTAPPAANNGTAGKPPTYVIQKDQHGNPVELSDTITFVRSYSQYSFEELRVADYSREDIHPISGSSQGARKAEVPPSLSIAAGSDRLDFKLDLSLMDDLVPNKFQSENADATIEGVMRDINHAPLLSAPVVAQHVKDLVPQFGFIGNHRDEAGHAVKLFHNTNVPLSAFICGVQGSGKSHTTACMLENALIPSKHLGRLEAPASALVFSYGSWSTGGAGFSVSEAVHLSRARPAFPGHNVQRITVLVSAHNGAIGSYYEDPSRNIRVIPFKLNARALDIAGLRALMGIGDKSPPLYMGQVEMVLMKMSATNKDGRLDYKSFTKAVQKIDLNEAQSQALKQRLAMLESFLDLDGKAVEPDFLPGEMIIMDLSDAFMSSSTACVLFKLGLDRFLESPVKSKMVVLDEAHKYMSDSPGSKFLADSLHHTIRVQRHLGTRMIISTQEPTVSTELIALCNMTVIHRFSSPTWYAALKRHISALGDEDKALMQRIEGLETGEALVYCPNTVLAQNDDGSLVKATGRLLKINIRKRITQDGGESIMAV